MKRVVIYYGTRKNFVEHIIPSDYNTLENIIIAADAKEYNIEWNCKNVVGFSMSYSGIAEGAEQNIISIIKIVMKDLECLYLQNPTENIRKEIERVFSEEIIQIEYYKYQTITKENILKLNRDFEKNIIGQMQVKQDLLPILYSLYRKRNKNKPVILMFYGNSGVGKTETAKFLSNILECQLFRKQFSMFQNNEFFNYLFGGKHYEPSFAKDLLERQSNIILLDEFDKINPACFNAFYQVFDEGIFEDKNYKVSLHNSIIICTANYKNIEDMRKALGDAIFFRFDRFIQFNDLSEESKIEMIRKVIEDERSELTDKEKNKIDNEDLFNYCIRYSKAMLNYRQIRALIRDYINYILTQIFLEENK